MPLKRALVECAVLALQDSCVFYPYCRSCFSRIDSDPEDTRLTCSKCGYCVRSPLEYRYRLSTRVARGRCIFGVTVFGNCLNQFFGIHATGLQRLVTDKTGALESSKSALLVKAVEECFIGKHFIFGIKVTENDIEPWVENTNGNSHMAQLIATQMILPKAAGLRGCTVVNYYKSILQKAAETTRGTVDPYEAAKHKGEPQRPIPHNSPTPGFTNDTLQSSDFLPRSLSRSHLDSSLSPTPPWQQTLGLITSSAEQEDSGKDDNKSTCFSEKCPTSTTSRKAWSGLTPPAHNTAGLLTIQVNDLSTSHTTNLDLTECQAHNEFPLSESLTEFLKDRNILDYSQQNKKLLESAHDDIDFMERSQVCVGDNESTTVTANESAEASEEEQCESSIYNCSADLFSNSPRTDMNRVAFVPLPACKGYADLLHSQSEDSSSLTSKQVLSENENDPNQAKCNFKESFQLSVNFDFIPPSQSTPAERVTVQKGMSLRRHVGESTKENIISANQTTLHCCVTPKSRYTKSDKIQYGLRTKKCFSARRGMSNMSVYKCRSSHFGDKDNSLIVPPTPHLCKTSLFKYHKSFNVTSKTDHFQTESVSDCESSECRQAVRESECNSENAECDWSRDLFSDSM